MTDKLTINDSWILERAGCFSSSFSGFISNLTGGLDLSAKIKEGIEIASQLSTPEGLEKLGVPGFVKPLMSEVMQSLGPELSSKIQEQIAKSLDEASRQRERALKEAVLQKEKTLEAAEKVRTQELAKAEEKLSTLEERLARMESTIGQRIASKLFGAELSSLTNALYEVAKERGITNEGLLHLIQMLPEFEALLNILNVRKFYRDHTAHSLRVAVLGDFILSKKSKAGGLENVIKDQLDLTSEEVRSAWWFTGLLHDIGTPIEKLFTSLNWSLVNEMLRCYPSLGMEITPMQIHLISDALANHDYLPVLMKGLPRKWQNLIKNGLGSDAALEERLVYKASSQAPLEYQPKRTKMDHGVVAAVSLLSTLGTPEQLLKEIPEDRPLIEAARAISLHNFASELGNVPFEKFPLIFLLTIADELQEWGRPIPVTVSDSYFTTSLQKITLLDAIFHDESVELWDIPYMNAQAKKIAKFDFRRLCSDKAKSLKGLDCAEQFPESDLWLLNVEQPEEKTKDKYKIKIATH